MFGIVCVLLLATGPFIGPLLVEMVLEYHDRRRISRRLRVLDRRITATGRDIDRLAAQIREVTR
jgi:hypothetical protein